MAAAASSAKEEVLGARGERGVGGEGGGGGGGGGLELAMSLSQQRRDDRGEAAGK